MDSILDQVMTSKHLSNLADFKPHQTLLDILEALSEREKEIIKMRHGLDSYEKKTLEDIGKKYNVTRERIRQIENSSLKKIIKNFDQTYLKKIEEIANSTLNEHGGMMAEDNLVKELLLMPGDNNDNRAAIDFILNQLLSHRFYLVKDTKHSNSFWKTPEASVDFYEEVISDLYKLLENHATPIALDQLMEKVKETELYKSKDDLTEKVIVNFIQITKKLEENPYEEWGLSHWSEIRPKRMNDKIYLILKKTNKPLHFTDIADTINQMKFDSRKAYPATIHNELILDNKYVLVGRGIYALKEWGYKPGVVSDVIVDILNEADKPLSKKEIVVKVLEKRLIKETTITLALMNKDLFTKDQKGRYALVEKK